MTKSRKKFMKPFVNSSIAPAPAKQQIKTKMCKKALILAGKVHYACNPK